MTQQVNALNVQEDVSDIVLPEAEPQKSAGQLLREAREAQGMDVGLLASILKVSSSQLEKLEADQYDQLPDMSFIRNFAISVARRLKIDEKLVLQQLPKPDSQEMVDAVMRLSQESYGTALKGEVLGRKKRSKVWWIALLVLLMALALLSFMPTQWYEGVLFQGRETQTEEGVFVPVQINQPVAQETPLIVSLPDDVTTAEVLVDSSVSSPSPSFPSEVAGATHMVTSPSPATANPEQTTTTLPVATQTIEITTKTESWVRIKSASGKMLHENMLRAGATLTLPLEGLPLSVRIGNPIDATVTVRGQPFDMSSFMGTGVANFEVK